MAGHVEVSNVSKVINGKRVRFSSSEDKIRVSDRSIFNERVARLIADLEAHERFWYYLAIFEVSPVLRCSR